ncbi:MFS transporter [Paludibacterium yongneupense]|uniref:MFS transporter n=1 Tax=Paludibacterium yongneupense TaxID=400061 RepID=UPI000418EB2B|nr:MFS transporter [Paludibacterium yongneupense]
MQSALPPQPPADGTEGRPAPAAVKLKAGSAAYRATARAMFAGGFSTFALLYCTQPLMPLFSRDFNLSPAAASGAVSTATTGLALSLIPASLLADKIGRKPVMNGALSLAALLMVAASFATSFQQFLVLRTLFGIVLAGLPAVAMAYLSEEIDPLSLGRSMGLYIAGNALGGMCGRFLSALIADGFGWRPAILTLGLLGAAGAWEFRRSLPPSRHFKPIRLNLPGLRRDIASHFSDDGLPLLFLCGFLLMGAFVSLYNYLGYRLMAAPYNLRPGALGLVFSLYVVGMWSSAWVGRMADRFGRRNMLWIMVALMGVGLSITLFASLLLMMLGIALFTFGFFGGHSVASSWIGRRALRARALASAFYLTAYYLGSSLLGTFSGLMWRYGGWNGVAAILGFALAILLWLALRLRTLLPLASVPGPAARP